MPLFQRQYVWQQEKHWEPLWDDILRKFSEYLEGRKDAPVHFLGAMVLDQKQTPTTHVEKRQVIDGQQRLTTFQIFLSAFRDYCKEQGCTELMNECTAFTSNKGMMAEPLIDKFKVYPTQSDRGQFADVIDSGSRAEVLKKHPSRKRPRSKKTEPRPRMIEAYLFFYERLEEFFMGTKSEPPPAEDVPLSQRMDECFQALKNSLQVVAIDLEKDDDAQVIFETLNARGEPLLPADLLRNYIFLRAARRGEPQESLYKQHWARFDDPFWREEVKQGRLLRPRSDLFMQHFLASRLTRDIPIKHLFIEYKFWIDKDKPFKSVEEELIFLARQGDYFRSIIKPNKGDPLFRLVTFLDVFDIRTSYPLLLSMLDVGLDNAQWHEISTVLESYLLRRAVCGLTTKNYNRVFLSITHNMRAKGMTPDNLTKILSGQTGDSAEWPSDHKFGEAWRNNHVYQILNNLKIVHIFKRLNDTFLQSKMEPISIVGSLSVEHILPQQWIAGWLLPDGLKGLSLEELHKSVDGDPRAEATRKRNVAVQTLGNLTILAQPLNSAISNSGWSHKKAEIARSSLLPLNLQLQEADQWNEVKIAQRSDTLLTRAIKIWPPPLSNDIA